MTTNKALFEHAFARFAAGDVDVLSSVLHEDFVEHNPANPSGRDPWIASVEASPVVGARMDVRHLIADDEYVVLHYRMNGDTDVVDLWRFQDGLIVEHWDVLAPVRPAEGRR